MTKNQGKTAIIINWNHLNIFGWKHQKKSREYSSPFMKMIKCEELKTIQIGLNRLFKKLLTSTYPNTNIFASKNRSHINYFPEFLSKLWNIFFQFDSTTEKRFRKMTHQNFVTFNILTKRYVDFLETCTLCIKVIKSKVFLLKSLLIFVDGFYKNKWR